MGKFWLINRLSMILRRERTGFSSVPHHLVGDCGGIKSISTMPLLAIVPAKLVVDHDRRCIEHIHI